MFKQDEMLFIGTKGKGVSFGDFRKLKDAGYGIKPIDTTNPVAEGRYNPFMGTFDVFGEDRERFVDGLSKTFNLSILEQKDDCIRIEYSKEPVSYDENELHRVYADYCDLLNSINGEITMVPVKN